MLESPPDVCEVRSSHVISKQFQNLAPTFCKGRIYATGDRSARSLQRIASFEEIRRTARKSVAERIACKPSSLVFRNPSIHIGVTTRHSTKDPRSCPSSCAWFPFSAHAQEVLTEPYPKISQPFDTPYSSSMRITLSTTISAPFLAPTAQPPGGYRPGSGFR